jgi:hypothetical protein
MIPMMEYHLTICTTLPAELATATAEDVIAIIIALLHACNLAEGTLPH